MFADLLIDKESKELDLFNATRLFTLTRGSGRAACFFLECPRNL